jgi:hypothetical protein
MQIAFNWFLGRNHLNRIIYNPCTGGCQDGLEKDRVNLNQGAESTVSYLISRMIKESYLKELSPVFVSLSEQQLQEQITIDARITNRINNLNLRTAMLMDRAMTHYPELYCVWLENPFSNPDKPGVADREEYLKYLERQLHTYEETYIPPDVLL